MQTPLTYMGVVGNRPVDSMEPPDELTTTLQQLSGSLGYSPEALLLIKSLNLLAAKLHDRAPSGELKTPPSLMALPADTSGHLVAA